MPHATYATLNTHNLAITWVWLAECGADGVWRRRRWRRIRWTVVDDRGFVRVVEMGSLVIMGCVVDGSCGAMWMVGSHVMVCGDVVYQSCDGCGIGG